MAPDEEHLATDRGPDSRTKQHAGAPETFWKRTRPIFRARVVARFPPVAARKIPRLEPRSSVPDTKGAGTPSHARAHSTSTGSRLLLPAGVRSRRHELPPQEDLQTHPGCHSTVVRCGLDLEPALERTRVPEVRRSRSAVVRHAAEPPPRARSLRS
jgi:hypothetical protein